MVFGWGKKKTTNKTIESRVLKKQVNLSEINDIIKENQMQRLKKITESAKSIKDVVEMERKNIIQIISQLESDTLKVDDVDKHLKLVIERGKEVVISGLRKETAVNLSNTEKYADVINLNVQIGQMLKRIGDILGANTRVMHIFARKYADKLKEHLAEVATKKAELQKLVDEHAKFESIVATISETCKKIKKSQKEIEEKNKEISKIKEEIKNYDKTMQNIELGIQNSKSKNEYQEFLKIRKEMDALTLEEDSIKHEIDLQFSKISRPLGKYSYISSLEKPLKRIMGELITNPSKVLIRENKDSIVEVLHAVIKAVVAGSVSVKDTAKAVQQIEETINRLDEFLKMKSDLSQKRATFENRLGIFNINELEEKERELIKTKDKKTHAESVTKNLENEVNDATIHMPQLVQGVEIKLKEISGTRITLKI
ncbi:MAG: hypothetical protein ACT4N1_04915 [Nitrososphaerota archaeon]